MPCLVLQVGPLYIYIYSPERLNNTSIIFRHTSLPLPFNKGVTRNAPINHGGLNKRFEARWLDEEGCDEIIKNAWDVAGIRGETSIMEKLRVVSRELHSWSREVIGDLQKRIKQLKADLETCRRDGITAATLNKEQVLRYRLEKMEDQWETHWKQSAHVEWLQNGDRNTTFFHKVASERKKHNTIKKLRREDGVMVEGEEGLQTLVTNYFSGLFTPMAGTNPAPVLQNIQPRGTNQMNEHLMASYTQDEIKEALDSIGDLKAPGADGMPAIFLQEILGDGG
jgi:hypothetical protein